MDPQSPARTLSAISDLNNKANSGRSDECKWAGEASTSHQVHQLLTKHHVINVKIVYSLYMKNWSASEKEKKRWGVTSRGKPEQQQKSQQKTKTNQTNKNTKNFIYLSINHWLTWWQF